MNVWDKLKGPFNPEYVKWRPGASSGDKSSALGLAYVDAREIQERLDDVVGPMNWSDRYHQCCASTICELSLRIDGEWILKSDGAGQSKVEADKGSISDALKRAAVKFGIGRYLYYLPKWWFPAVPTKDGKSCYFPDESCRKMTQQLGAWQREYFKGWKDDGEVYTPPPMTTTASTQPLTKPIQQPVQPPSNGKDVESAYKEFASEMSHANSQRLNDQLRAIQPADIIHELRSLNVKLPDGFVITNWQQLKGFGADTLTNLTRELANRPCLIGSEIPF